MFAQIAYLESLREIDRLYADFNAYKNDLGAQFLENFQQTAKGDAAVYLRRLNEVHNKFLNAAIKNYYFIKTLHELYNQNPDCKIEYPIFDDFVEAKLKQLFKTLPLTRANSQENLDNFSFVKAYRKLRLLKDEINSFRKHADDNLKRDRKKEYEEK